MAAIIMANQRKNTALRSDSSSIRTQALSFTFKPMIFGMEIINEKIQQPGMITLDRKT